MKKLIKLMFSCALVTPPILVVACGPAEDETNKLTIFADGVNDAEALQKIGEDFKEEYGLEGLTIKSQPVDMKNTANLMVSNPKMVKTDLYNMPHDYIGNLHSTRVMTNLNDVKLDEKAQNKTLDLLQIKVQDKKLIAPNGKTMGVEWNQFLEDVYKDWQKEGEIYGKPSNENVIDDIAIYEKISGQEKRFDYIWPSTFQTNLAEINDKFEKTGTGFEIDEKGNYNFDAQDLMKTQKASGENSGNESSKLWNKEYLFNDFGADFVSSAFFMEIDMKRLNEKASQSWKRSDIQVINNQGVAFPDPNDPTKSNNSVKEEFVKHWKEVFTFLVNDYYKGVKKAPDYEANGKMLKGIMGEGELFMWNTATWDMAGATKEYKDKNATLNKDPNKMKLKFGQPIKWNKNNDASPLLMVGGFGTYGLSQKKELSVAFMQYLARKSSSYTWMKKSRGMMFDKSSFEAIVDDINKIFKKYPNWESNTEEQAKSDQEINTLFDPISIDKPYIDSVYAKTWIEGMEVSSSNANLARIIPSTPSWTSFLGEYKKTISAMYSAIKTDFPQKFLDENLDTYLGLWVKALNKGKDWKG